MTMDPELASQEIADQEEDTDGNGILSNMEEPENTTDIQSCQVVLAEEVEVEDSNSSEAQLEPVQLDGEANLIIQSPTTQNQDGWELASILITGHMSGGEPIFKEEHTLLKRFQS